MTAEFRDAAWLELTLAQLDFWEEFRFHPDRPLSTVAHCIVIEGAADEIALVAALSRLAREAEVLALRFRDGPGGPRQRVDPGRIPAVRVQDLQRTPAPEARARRMMAEDIARPIDLERDPLCALWLLRVGPQRWLWYLRGHHILLDGYGMSLIERRAAALYAEALGHRAGPGPFLPFARYLEEETAYRAGPRHDRDLAHWAGVLRDIPDLGVLPKGGEDYAPPPLAAAPDLPAGLEGQLQQAARAAGMGWPDLLTLLSAAWIARDHPAGAPGLPVWLPYQSRLGSVAAAIPALVVNILPLIVSHRPGETLGACLDRSGQALRGLRRHGRYRVEQMAADRGLRAGERFFFSPLVNVLPFDPPEFPGCTAQSEVLAAGPGDGFNLTWSARSDGSELALSIDADPASAGEVAAAARALVPFLARACAPDARDRPLAELLAERSAGPAPCHPARTARPIASRQEKT
ncbi:condensation domain-containing protein [Rhodovulum sp. YEN HP10]|uniref:condensation domain-containing protein n=1 Tax=Rhodovulum sp. HP10 TaxID=3387397 RepID=UPI0039E03EA6